MGTPTDAELDESVRRVLNDLLAQGAPYSALPLLDPATKLLAPSVMGAFDTLYKAPTDELAEVVAEQGTDLTEVATTVSTGRLSEASVATQITEGVAAKVVISDTAPPDLPADAVWVTVRDDTTPPSIPSGLAAEVTADGIVLTWNASVDDSGAIGDYRVYRDGALLAIVTDLEYLDAAATWDTEHDYAVAARDPFGNESAPSATVPATRGVAGAPTIATTDLVAHFRASDLLLADGAGVTRLDNRVADGADLVMFGTPAFETAGARPSIVFDGVNHAATAALGVFAQPVTRFVVYKLRDTASGRTIMGTSNSAANRQTFATGATAHTVYAGSTQSAGPAPETSGVHVAAIRYQAGTSRLNIDGTVYTIGSPGTEAAEGFRVAANTSGATRTHMEFFEGIQYAAALSDAAIDALVAQLKTWYGVA